MKSLISGFLSVALFILPLAGKADVPNQVVLHYTGDIIVKPCTVSTNQLMVNFGDVDVARLQNVGDTSQAVNAGVRFSDCDVDSNVEVSFVMPGPSFLYKTSLTPCGFYFTPTMSSGPDDSWQGWPTNMPYGITGSAMINGKSIDLACYDGTARAPLIISPLQREGSLSTSFNLTMTFRIMRITTAQPNFPMSVKSEAFLYMVVSYK
ncbi:fimbrial protein [Ewingella americana]|uniref:fimbrial protein n=1 Tax=Ewingella americana TaxID=41202 RepID=UPI00112A960C|nr:type 1 fimbrial protein [Ewingella americana]